jgi:hypothetical protein
MVGFGDLVARGLVRVEYDDDAVQKGLKSTQSSSQRAFKAMSKGAIVALGGIAVGAASAVKAAVDLGEQVNKTKVVFAGSEKQLLSWGKTTAKTFGISNRAALEALGTFGNMLVPMGFARKEAAGMSKTMVELAADMASFNNASPEDTLLALRAGLAGETEPLRRFGVFLNVDRMEQEALTEGIIAGEKALKAQGGQLTAQQKALATFSIIMKDTKDTQGDFVRTSSSLANQQRILTASWEDARAELGTSLLPVVTSLARGLGSLINLTKEHSSVVKIAVVTIASLATGIIAVNLGLSIYNSRIATAIVRTKAMRLALAATPLGIVALAVGALAIAYLRAKQETDEFTQATNRAKNALNGMITAADRAAEAELSLRAARVAMRQSNLSLRDAEDALKNARKRGDPREVERAEVNLQQARIDNSRALQALTMAGRENRAAQENQTKTNQKARDSIAETVEQAGNLEEKYKQLQGRARTNTRELNKLNEEAERDSSKVFARNMDGLAQKLEIVARDLKDTNPQLAEQARRMADNYRRAADLARALQRIPSEVTTTVDVHFTAAGRPFRGEGMVGLIKNFTQKAMPDTITSGAQRDVTPSLWDEIGIGRAYGLGVTSTYRPGAVTSTGNRSLHGTFPAQAVDMSSGSSSGFNDPAMRSVFNAVIGRSGLDEVILSPYWWHPGSGVTRISAPSVMAAHWNHIHIGDRQGDGIVGAASKFRGDGTLRAWPRPRRRAGESRSRFMKRIHAIDVSALPIGIELAQVKAALSPSELDDVTAAQKEVNWWTRGRKTRWLSTRQRIEVLRNLRSAMDTLDDARGETVAQLQAFTEARAGFMREFSPNIFGGGAGGLGFGASGPVSAGLEAGRTGATTVVNQYFNKPPEDNHLLLRSAQFEAETVFGG